MKKITIDDLEWQKDPHYFTPSRTKSYYGRARDVQVIVIHWWNEPDRAGTLEPTADYLERADTSIHFIVSGDRVIQMVNMGNTAFHARSANPISVGIEVDPKTPGNTYETVGALVRFIRTYYGNIPLKKHSDYVNTTCPGTISLKKIEQYASNKKEETVAYGTTVKRLSQAIFGRTMSKSEFNKHHSGKTWQKLINEWFTSPEGKRRRKLLSDRKKLLKQLKEENKVLDEQIQALRDVHSQSKDALAKKAEELQKTREAFADTQRRLNVVEAKLNAPKEEAEATFNTALQVIINKVKEKFSELFKNRI